MQRAEHEQEPVEKDATGLSVAIAVARQRLLDAHFTHVLELIQRSLGEVSAPQALTIYARVHRLTELDIQALRNRVLVHLGRVTSTDVTDLPHTFVAIDGAVEWDITASLVARIRKRLGGRRNHGLREWIDQHSGHVEWELIRLHIDNLVSLADAMGESARPVEVARTYTRELGIREELWEPLYWGLLERQYQQLPARALDEAEVASPEAALVGRRGRGEARLGSG